MMCCTTGEVLDHGRTEMQRRWAELWRIEALSPRFKFQAWPDDAHLLLVGSPCPSRVAAPAVAEPSKSSAGSLWCTL